MPQYTFKCNNCETEVSLELAMNDDAGRTNACCVICGENLKRVFHSPNAIVKVGLGDMKSQLKKDEHFVNVDGRPIKMNFVDHRDREAENSNISKHMSGVRYDEKSGQHVVDVKSNVKDPFGEANKGKVKTETKQVNAPYKMPRGGYKHRIKQGKTVPGAGVKGHVV